MPAGNALWGDFGASSEYAMTINALYTSITAYTPIRIYWDASVSTWLVN